MKTPQQIENEVEKEIKNIKWRLDRLEKKKRINIGRANYISLSICNHEGKDSFCPICEDKYKDRIKEIISRELFK